MKSLPRGGERPPLHTRKHAAPASAMRHRAPTRSTGAHRHPAAQTNIRSRPRGAPSMGIGRTRPELHNGGGRGKHAAVLV
eukprot:4315102-Prymnesium_polylepis.1